MTLYVSLYIVSAIIFYVVVAWSDAQKSYPDFAVVVVDEERPWLSDYSGPLWLVILAAMWPAVLGIMCIWKVGWVVRHILFWLVAKPYELISQKSREHASNLRRRSR